MKTILSLLCSCLLVLGVCALGGLENLIPPSTAGSDAPIQTAKKKKKGKGGAKKGSKATKGKGTKLEPGHHDLEKKARLKRLEELEEIGQRQLPGGKQFSTPGAQQAQSALQKMLQAKAAKEAAALKAKEKAKQLAGKNPTNAKKKP